MKASFLFVALAALAVAASADPGAIFAFNNEALQAVRDYGIPSQIASRLYSAVHIAQHLAIKGSDDSQHPAQAAYAGHTVLNLYFPYRFARLDKALAPFLEDLSDSERAAAESAGRKAGLDTVQLYSTDGFDKYAPFTPAPEGGPVGEYQFTPNQTNAVYPQIATTRTVVIKAPYEGEPPRTIPSPEYTADLEETYTVGAKNSTERNEYDNNSPNYWAYGNTTSTVAGAFNLIAQSVLPENITTADAALLFAQLNAATWDASISTYRQKYLKPTWRPITAIRQGDGSQEDAAFVDPQWTPLLSTPAHPEHPSGHSATAASAAAVLRKFLGTDEVSFTIESEFPGDLEPRSYTSFTQAVDEIADSRVLGGVHFRHATDVGNDIGTRVGEYVYDNLASTFKRTGSSGRML